MWTCLLPLISFFFQKLFCWCDQKQHDILHCCKLKYSNFFITKKRLNDFFNLRMICLSTSSQWAKLWNTYQATLSTFSTSFGQKSKPETQNRIVIWYFFLQQTSLYCRRLCKFLSGLCDWLWRYWHFCARYPLHRICRNAKDGKSAPTLARIWNQAQSRLSKSIPSLHCLEWRKENKHSGRNTTLKRFSLLYSSLSLLKLRERTEKSLFKTFWIHLIWIWVGWQYLTIATSPGDCFPDYFNNSLIIYR